MFMIGIGQAGCHFMDKTEPEMATSEAVTRESLIALSYLLPDQAPPSEPKATKFENPFEGGSCDKGAEKYMSELMSISKTQSPEMKALPAAQAEPEG